MAATAPFSSDNAALDALPPRIAFFDGVCSFCDGTVKWLIANDPDARLHFAPLQGETAEVVRAAFPDVFPTDIDTFVYFQQDVSQDARKLSLRSSAVFALAEDLDIRWIRRFHWMPRWLTDIAYRVFAANRYRLFGKLDACDIPTPADRARLLA